MTARLLSVSPTTLQPVNSWLSQRSRKSTRHTAAQDRSELPASSVPKSEPLGTPQRDRKGEDALLAILLEAVQEGVIVASTTLQLIYLNHQAKELCDQLRNSELDSALPAAIAAACHRFLQSPSVTEPLIAEFQEHPEQFVRVRVRWLQLGGSSETVAPSYLLIQLEDCYQALKEELALEKQKYDLTDREAEVWIMMRQKYSYQEIAELLTISMNTVKTHVKNVNSKRKTLMNDRQVWYSR
jgi:DNA-binding CsgD family transcriptional regulator